jgi:hypothetical protein
MRALSTPSTHNVLGVLEYKLKRPEGSKKLMVHYVAFQRTVLLLRSVSK